MASHRNIILENITESIPYKSGPKPSTSVLPPRNRESHGEWLLRQFDEARENAKSYTPTMVAAIKAKQGVYLEFTGKDGYELVTKGLENIRSNIRLLNVHPGSNSATVYIPSGKETLVIKKITDYINESTKKGSPKNNALMASIEQIKAARVEAFWIGDKEEIPMSNPVWCEIWLRTDKKIEDSEKIRNNFWNLCDELEIQHTQEFIDFPERSVVLAKVTNQNLKDIIGLSDSLAELRRTPESAKTFIDMPPEEEREWAANLKDRISIVPSDSVVCVLDTGISYLHPLLSDSIAESNAQAVEPDWGISDHDGHGTGMAGIALYNDLKKAVLSSDPVLLTHSLESVKILPPSNVNKEELYGAITQQGMLLAEINQPDKKRVFCMAVTADDKSKDGRPSSWSGAIDSIIAGANDGVKRIAVVSAGNVEPIEVVGVGYPDINRIKSIENPGQSWNAITVGAYSNLLQTSIPNYHAVANVGGLSPHSTTSLTWQPKWPIKPDIVCAGGNMATDGQFYTDTDDLSLLTLNNKFSEHLFETTRATSSATAQAAYMIAKIRAEYPALWPETIRAMLIHSAKWTDEMERMFCQDGRKTFGRRQLLKACGYGIPNLARALQCVDNNVSMVIQGELQPYKKQSDRCSMNEMHLHTLPWPTEVLKQLGEVHVTMRVTLSYYVEPGPGEIGWKDKYRYPSCGLRFDVNKPSESKEEFIHRINIAMRDENEDQTTNDGGSDRWLIGKATRDVGSIHSDYWTGTAVDLCNSYFIAVYPTIGWWRQRTNLKMYNKHVRYALVVSISTPSSDVDFYTPIATQIEEKNTVPNLVTIP